MISFLYSGDFCWVWCSDSTLNLYWDISPLDFIIPGILLFLAWRNLIKGRLGLSQYSHIKFTSVSLCKKRPISTYPTNTFMYDFNLALQVCFMGCVQMCWNAFCLLLYHLHIAHFKENLCVCKLKQNKTKQNIVFCLFVCLLIFNFWFFEVINSAEKHMKYKLYSL